MISMYIDNAKKRMKKGTTAEKGATAEKGDTPQKHW